MLFQTKESREVLHFHYTHWPDFGVPSSPNAFLDFLEVVRGQGVLDNDVGPAVIHCSAGIGRSGTFCLVDTALILVSYSSFQSTYARCQSVFFVILFQTLLCLNDSKCKVLEILWGKKEKVLKTRLLKTLWQKEKMLVSNIFSFSYNVFFLSKG